MSQVNATVQDSARDAKQRSPRRKSRVPKARTPEPKEIVSGAGHPLDPGVRRELEARLGHDFSRVRVHTDRDAAALTDLVGADAVTVGADIFFGEGKYRPGAEDGRRLLAHELLHTVQAPHALGALQAGRGLGAVSLPQDAIEREAEQGAQNAHQAAATPGATPGWLRYATVNADRYRTERLDPATLVDRLAAGILRSLRGDPTDSSGRVRLQLARFAPELQSAVLDQLSDQLPSSDYARVLELVEAAEQGPAEADAAQTPEPVTDAADRAATDREQRDEQDRGEQDRQQQLDQDAQQSEGPRGHRKRGKAHRGRTDEQDRPNDRTGEGGGAPQAEQSAAGQDQQPAPAAEQAPPQAVQEPAAAAPPPGPEQAPAADEAVPPPAVSVLGSPEGERKEAGTKPSAGTKPQEPAAQQLPQAAPAKPERVDRIAEAKDSPLAQHGLLEGDQQRGEAREEEKPLGLETGAETEVHDAPADEGARQAGPVAAEPELKPEDFLPGADLDVSAVPTADQISVPTDGSPAAPAEAPEFPEPPVTKAEQVQATRENQPQDEEEPTAPEPAQPAAGAQQSVPEPTPSTEAEDRTTRDLQPEKPVEQEIGPEPAAATAQSAAPAPAPEPQPQPEAPAAEPQEAEQAPETADTAEGAHLLATEASAPERAAPGTAGPVGGGTEAVLAEGPGGLDTAPETAPSVAPGPAAEQADAPGELTAQPAPDASLEPGGGACAGPQQPSTEADKQDGDGGGCGGGGGGGEAKQEEKPAPPDVSGQDPQSALSTAAGLPPDQLATTLDGVDGAVDRTVGEQHAQLQAAPPTVQRPSGAPQTQSGTPEAAPPAGAVTERLERVGPDGAESDRQKAEQKKVEGQNPADQVQAPHVADDAGNQVSAEEAQRMQGAVDDVPTTDPALNTTVGPAPKVELTGDSDPARNDKQAAQLKDRSSKILGVGRDDAAKPMGEDRIFPDVPKQNLTATVPGGGGGKGGGARAGAAVDTKPGIGIVTQQERGPQIQAAVGQGQSQLGSEQAKQKQGEAQARHQNQADIDQAVADNAQAQAGERSGATEQIKSEREQWHTEQDQKITDAGKDADQEHTDKNDQISKKRTDSDKDVQDRQDKDNQQIQDKKKEAEDKAQKEKERKKEESDGFWGWVKSKVKAAFDALVDAVTKIFDAARGLINGIIDGFRTWVNSVIDAVRQFAVDLINKLADALIKICDVLLAAFPELRDKFRKKIEEWRDKAIAKVNEWADKLKSAVNKLLDVLAAGLNALLNALEAGLKAAIEAVRKQVMAAIDFVEKAIAVFGEFAALIGDIAPDPGGWLKKLGNAAMEGIQHYLWGAIKSAVRQWFNEKVESVVGLTSTIINVLVKGCISMAQIGRMAWEAIVASLPGIIISIVIEKLVSMIVPAAGAIMTIIQGLMAAWNTISKIIAAIGKFVAFLKAVKAGPAACLFADAVAAGVVALLDFISNFLLSKLKGAGKAVGTKLKGIAQKILKGLAKAGRGARKAAGRAVNKARAGLRRATQSLRKRPAPGRARPTRTGPARHTVRHADHRPEQTNGRPRREVTHPKSTQPRRPTSAVGRTLNRSRQTVKAALNRVRVAARTLGRKLLNSKLGRALTNGAHRIRDAYRRQRDRIRDWHNKRKQQRAERRQRENSPQAKQNRLDLIAARIRPRIGRVLSKGVRGLVLRAMLASMRIWYRLSGLSIQGLEHFNVLATLNPSVQVTSALTVKERVLLDMLDEVAAEILDHPQTRRGAAQIYEKTAGSTADERRFGVPQGVGFASLARFMNHHGDKMLGFGNESVRDVFEFEGDADRQVPAVTHTMLRETDTVRNARERRIQAGADEAERAHLRSVENASRLQRAVVQRKRESGDNEEPLPYQGRVNKRGDFKEGVAERLLNDSTHSRRVVEGVETMARGERVSGDVGRDAAFLGTLILGKEVHRNQRSAIHAGMLLQMASMGSRVSGITPSSDPKKSFENIQVHVGEEMPMADALKYLPMEGAGAMAHARTLAKQRAAGNGVGDEASDKEFKGKNVQGMANREILLLQLWIKSLDIKANEGGEVKTLEQLKQAIRSKMLHLYGLQ